MPHALITKADLMNALWERSDRSVEHTCDDLLAAERLLHRTRTALGFLQHFHHIDPDYSPRVEVLLPELDEELNRPMDNGHEPLRWLRMAPPKGELIGLPLKRKRGA